MLQSEIDCEKTPLIDLIFNKLGVSKYPKPHWLPGAITYEAWLEAGLHPSMFKEIDKPGFFPGKPGIDIPDKLLTREEFRDWCNEGASEAAQGAVEKSFSELDIDGNLSLGEEEVGPNLVRLLDSNNDEYIELSDLVKLTDCTVDLVAGRARGRSSSRRGRSSSRRGRSSSRRGRSSSRRARGRRSAKRARGRGRRVSRRN